MCNRQHAHNYFGFEIDTLVALLVFTTIFQLQCYCKIEWKERKFVPFSSKRLPSFRPAMCLCYFFPHFINHFKGRFKRFFLSLLLVNFYRTRWGLWGVQIVKKGDEIICKVFLLNTIDLEFHYAIIFEYICELKTQLNQQLN